MDSQNKSSEDVIKRLDILISLVLEQSSAQGAPPMSDKISRLADLGVSPADIARILRKPLNNVTATLSQRKSRKKAKANG
jgi:transposase-like protein